MLDALESGDSVTAIRANPAKISAGALRGRFESAGAAVPWCAEAFYLDSRPVFSLDPLLHAGAYYVQDASAMYVGEVVRWLAGSFDARLRILDLCAAPGGKSTAVAAALGPSGLLVANEVIGSRAGILSENLVKWGSVNTVVTNSDPKDFGRLGASFDIVLADVPCSGEGMFRKDPDAVAQWSPENVSLCAARQRRIVADVWPALREGGWLVYSTCTFNRSENDGNVEWICSELGAEACAPVDLLRARETYVETQYGLQFAPGLTRGEGQYVALMRKTSSAAPVSLKPSKPLRKAVCDWLKDGLECFYRETSSGTLIKGYPQVLMQDIRQMEDRLRVLRSGVAVAAVKGRDLVPQTDLALSQAFNSCAFPSAVLSKDQALQYLRCESLRLPDAPKGFLTVTYDGLPLGFVKNLGTRANNLFPQAWRLRM